VAVVVHSSEVVIRCQGAVRFSFTCVADEVSLIEPRTEVSL
jgi:hypothetical protein